MALPLFRSPAQLQANLGSVLCHHQRVSLDAHVLGAGAEHRAVPPQELGAAELVPEASAGQDL